METGLHCPLPELAEVLWSYIKPRNEATEIRHAIGYALRDNIIALGPQLLKTTLADGGTIANTATESKYLGVRKAYIQAVRARRDAQVRFDALKAELNELSGGHGQDEHEKLAMEAVDTFAFDRISSIRQNQRQRKLQVVDAVLDDLASHHQSSGGWMTDDVAKGEGYSLTPPPNSQSGCIPWHTDKESEIFQLKRAFLRARNHVDAVDSFTRHVEIIPDNQARLNGSRAYALQCARDDLISWIENELAKISDNPETQNINESQHVVSENDAGTTQDQPARIHNLYAQYITARKSVVRSAVSTTVLPSGDDQHTTLETSTVTKTQDQRESLSSAVLAYMATLRMLSEDEPAMMQQTSYLRRQLTHDLTSTQQLVTRLADESHLVAPGSRDVFAWADATEEAKRRDAGMVWTALEAGEQSIRGAQQNLES